MLEELFSSLFLTWKWHKKRGKKVLECHIIKTKLFVGFVVWTDNLLEQNNL